jgi:hypothetical protein
MHYEIACDNTFTINFTGYLQCRCKIIQQSISTISREYYDCGKRNFLWKKESWGPTMELFRCESFMECAYVGGVKFPMELIFTTRNLLLFFFSSKVVLFCPYVCVRLYRMYLKCLDKLQERGLYIKTKEKSHINIVAEIVWYICLLVLLTSVTGGS